LQQAAGNAAVSQLVTQSTDATEHEADAVADQATSTTSRDGLQARALPEASSVVSRSVASVVHSPGHPLDSKTRSEMESQFGRDLSNVRIHSDAAAEDSAREMLAHAFTVGPHIVFDAGRFSPSTREGRRLLAHELTHVAQQAETGAQAAIQREPMTKDEIRKRLEDVRRQLSTGSGVRTNEATAKLKDEEAQLAAALAQSERDEVRRRLEANQKQQATGSGVRSPEANARLKEEEDQLQRQLGVGSAPAAATPTLAPGGPTAPGGVIVDWGGGNLRGLAAEGQVITNSYPGATQLPKGFPGADLVEGGDRTQLTGFGRGKAGKLPLSADSVKVEGGTVIQVKTLKNSEPYYQEPGTVLKTLEKGMEDLANVPVGKGKSEQVGGEFRRVELGQPARRILHVELEQAPTPEQVDQLEQLREAGRSYGAFGAGEEVHVVVRWPGAAPKSVFSSIELAPGSGSAALNVGVAGIGVYSRGKWHEHQLETEGYAAKGVAAHQTSPGLTQAGSAARGDSFDMESPLEEKNFNLNLWQRRLRERAAEKKPGDRLTINWQVQTRDNKRTHDVAVTYEKLQDGTWRAGPPSDDMEGKKVPDINRIIAPDATNIDVELELGIKGA